MKFITELSFIIAKIEVTISEGQTDCYYYLYWQSIIICTEKIKLSTAIENFIWKKSRIDIIVINLCRTLVKKKRECLVQRLKVLTS